MSQLIVEVQEYGRYQLLAYLSFDSPDARPQPIIHALQAGLISLKESRGARVRVFQSLIASFPEAKAPLIGFAHTLRIGDVASVTDPTWNSMRGEYIGAVLTPDVNGPRATGSDVRFRFQALDPNNIELTIFDQAKRSIAVFPDTNPLVEELPKRICTARNSGSLDPLTKLLRFAPSATCILQALIFLLAGSKISAVTPINYNTTLGNYFSVLLRVSMAA